MALNTHSSIKEINDYCRRKNYSIWIGKDCQKRPAIVGFRKNDYPKI